MQEDHEDEEPTLKGETEGEERMPKDPAKCQHNRCRNDGEYSANGDLYCAEHIDEVHRKVALDWCKAHPDLFVSKTGSIRKLPQTPSQASLNGFGECP